MIERLNIYQKFHEFSQVNVFSSISNGPPQYFAEIISLVQTVYSIRRKLQWWIFQPEAQALAWGINELHFWISAKQGINKPKVPKVFPGNREKCAFLGHFVSIPDISGLIFAKIFWGSLTLVVDWRYSSWILTPNINDFSQRSIFGINWTIKHQICGK